MEVHKMDNYTMRGYGRSDYMSIIAELEDSFFVRIVKNHGGREEIISDFISKDLFDSCVRTGYLTKQAMPRFRAVNA
jgi:hypothetical protein